METVNCEGWWEQAGYGRQPMEALQLTFDDGEVAGSGIDIIGPFTLRGTLGEGRIILMKHYLGQHTVDYLGVYDGEGLFTGKWQIAFFSGPWLIRIKQIADSERAETAEITDLV